MEFVQARWYTQGGNGAPTRIVIHDAEYPEKMSGAEDIAAYFQHVDRKASAHFVCDADSTVQCVLEADIAYHAPPNANSIGIELVGYAKQTTADWLDDFGTRMLRGQCAPLVRDLAARHGIPLKWLSVAELVAGEHGITSHNNVSLAWHKSTHTDPGPNFPIEQFMAWVAETAPPLPHPSDPGVNVDEYQIIIAVEDDGKTVRRHPDGTPEFAAIIAKGNRYYELAPGEDELWKKFGAVIRNAVPNVYDGIRFQLHEKIPR